MSSSLNEFLESIFDRDGAAGVVECFSFLFGAFVITRDGIVIGADHEFLDLIGYDRSELYGMSAFELISADEHEAMRTRFRMGDGSRYELKLLTKTKQIKHVLVSPKIFHVKGEIYRLAEFIDISDQIESREKLRLASEVFSATSDMLANIDSEGCYLTVNKAYANAFGMKAQDIIGRSIVDIFGRTFFDDVIAPNLEKIKNGNSWRYQQWFEFPSTGRRFMDVSYVPLMQPDGIFRGFTVNARDITDLKIAEEKIAELNRKLKKFSFVDGLTGIANRRIFDLTITREWSRAKRAGTSLSLIMIDIDFFKAYNDNYGHLAGDDCLKEIARALQLVVGRSSDLVARFGGEEFVILLPDTQREDAINLAEQCRRVVEELDIRHEFSDVCDVVTISLGVASIIPSGHARSRSLVSNVDKLLYQAKHNGRNRVEFDSD